VIPKEFSQISYSPLLFAPSPQQKERELRPMTETMRIFQRLKDEQVEMTKGFLKEWRSPLYSSAIFVRRCKNRRTLQFIQPAFSS